MTNADLDSFKRALSFLGLTLFIDPRYSQSFPHGSLGILKILRGEKRIWQVIFLEGTELHPGLGCMQLDTLFKMFTIQHSFYCERIYCERTFAALEDDPSLMSIVLENPFYGCETIEELEIKLALLGENEKAERKES